MSSQGETVEVTHESDHLLCISDAAVSALASIVGALTEEIEVDESCEQCGGSGEVSGTERMLPCPMGCEPEPRCDNCEEAGEDLSEVPDCDPSVGYHSTLLVCRACLSARAGRRNFCGSCV